MPADPGRVRAVPDLGVLSATGKKLGNVADGSIFTYGAGTGFLTHEAANTIIFLVAAHSQAVNLGDLPPFMLAIGDTLLTGCRIHNLNPTTNLVRFSYLAAPPVPP
jgi:hypothetical protein